MLNKIKIIIRYSVSLIRVLLLETKSNNLLFFGYEDSSSGAAVLSLYMVKEFSRKYNIVFITPEKKDLDKEFKKYAKLVLRLPNRRLYHYLFKKGFKNAILNALPSCFDAQYLKQNNFHVITLIHELHYLIDEFNMKANVERAKEYSDVIIFPSNYCYKSFEEHYGKIKCKVLIKPQGLFLTKGYKSNKLDSKEYVCRKHGLDFNNPIVLMVGIGDKRKGMDLFFDLCFLNKNEPITFIHVGKMLDDMKDYCVSKYNGFPLNFINVDYIRESDILFKYYDAASILVMLSREEPFGSVVLEAFSAGTPVIGFANSGGYNDIVLNGQTGFLTEYLNISDMSKRIKVLIYSNDCLIEMGKNAKSLVDNMSFDEYCLFIQNNMKEGFK